MLKDQSGGKIFWWRDCVLHVGSMTQNTMHHHHAVQFCAGLDADVNYRTNLDNTWERQKSLVVPADAPHQLAPDGSRVASLFLDPDHRGFDTSKLGQLSPETFRELVSPIVAVLGSALSFLEEEPHDKTLHEWRARFLSLLLSQSAPPERDSRIDAAVRIIKDNVDQKISLDDVAQSVSLSPSRFAYLFKEFTSLPFRQYILWQRLLHATSFFGGEMTLTEIAYRCGFSDSAHLSRTFRSMFGTSPSDLSKHNQFIQVSDRHDSVG